MGYAILGSAYVLSGLIVICYLVYEQYKNF